MGKSQLVRALHRAVLGPAGFSLRGSTWNRRSGDLVDVVTVVPSKADLSIEVYLGVHDPVIFERVWGPHRGSVIEADCLASLDIGELIGEPWRIWHWEDASHAARLEAALEQDGLPWLSQMHDRERIVEFLLTRPRALITSETILLALLEEGIGRRDAACERMRLLIRRMSGLSPGWEEKARTIAAAMGCALDAEE
jgi:hypothetical protein